MSLEEHILHSPALDTPVARSTTESFFNEYAFNCGYSSWITSETKAGPKDR